MADFNTNRSIGIILIGYRRGNALGFFYFQRPLYLINNLLAVSVYLQ